MVFIKAERGRVAEDIAAHFQQAYDVPKGETPKARALATESEMLSLSRITQTLAPQLVDHDAPTRHSRP